MKIIEDLGVLLCIAAVFVGVVGAGWIGAMLIMGTLQIHLVTGGWTFSGLALLTLGATIIATREKTFPLGYGAVGLFLIINQAFGTTTPTAWMGRHWLLVLVGVPAFLVTGFFWSRFKLSQLTRKIKAAKATHQKVWLTANGYPDRTDIPLELEDKWKEEYHYADSYWSNNRFEKPTLESHRQDIIIWWAYWPVSLGIDVCKDWLVNLYEELFRRTAHLYKRAVDNVWEAP